MPTEPVIERILDLEKEQEQLIQQVRREEERLRREELLNEDASNQARWKPTVGNDSWSQYDQVLLRRLENLITTAQPTIREMIGLQLMDLRFLIMGERDEDPRGGSAFPFGCPLASVLVSRRPSILYCVTIRLCPPIRARLRGQRR